MIRIFPWKSSRTPVVAAVLALMLVLSGCGGDDEEAPTTPAATAPAETAETGVERPETEREEQPNEVETTETGSARAESPEDQPGGAGDEEPARTLALFTARDGRISPRVVRVPAFISVRAELRSADGVSYGLRFGDTTIRAGGELSSASAALDGLRPGEAIVGRPTGPGNPVRIAATAEPGP
jgi:hypothetical protein